MDAQAPSAGHWRARACGLCRFGLAPDAAGAAGAAPSAAPSAAAVLVFGRTTFAGREGILAQVASDAAARQLDSASAYCEVCRETTWLCDADAACLDAAVVDFALNAQRAVAIDDAVAAVRSCNRVPLA